MKRYDESGRSMLEIIMVLAIGGLLILGGLSLWQSVEMKNRSRVVIQRIVAMKSERLATMTAHSNRAFARSERGPYGTTLSIRNGIEERNKAFYWVSVYSMDSDFRSALIQEARKRLDPCWVQESRTDVTFYFPKFPKMNETNKDLEDKIGAGYISEPNKEHELDSCPEHAVCDEDYRTTGCDPDYYLKEGGCSPCPQNAQCLGGTESFVCDSGYYKSGDSCESCGDHVASVKIRPMQHPVKRIGGEAIVQKNVHRIVIVSSLVI